MAGFAYLMQKAKALQVHLLGRISLLFEWHRNGGKYSNLELYEAMPNVQRVDELDRPPQDQWNRVS
jgi:hypothetical protein